MNGTNVSTISISLLCASRFRAGSKLPSLLPFLVGFFCFYRSFRYAKKCPDLFLVEVIEKLLFWLGMPVGSC